jgi:tetratricopeptide repeat protein
MIDTTVKSWEELYELSRQALQLKQLDEAERTLLAALRIAEDEGDETREGMTLNSLARVYSVQKQYPQAVALLRRLIVIKEKALGRNHQQVASILGNLAEMYAQTGDVADELALRERVLDIRTQTGDVDDAALYKLRLRVDQLRHMMAVKLTPPALIAQGITPTAPKAAPAPAPQPAKPAAKAPEAAKPSDPTKGDAPNAANGAKSRVEPIELFSSIELAASAVSATAPAPTPARKADAPKADLPYIVNPDPVAPERFRSRPTPATGTYRPIEPEAFVADIYDAPRVAVPATPSASADGALQEVPRPSLLQRLPVSPRILAGLAAGIVLAVWTVSSAGHGSKPKPAAKQETSSAGAVQSSAPPITTTVPPAPVTATTAAVESAKTTARTDKPADKGSERAANDKPREGERAATDTPSTLRLPSIASDKLAKIGDIAVQRIDSSTRAVIDSSRRIESRAPEFKKVKVSDVRPPGSIPRR